MKVPTARPTFEADDIESIKKDIEIVLSTGRLILGPYTKKFESEFASYTGTKHAIATSSGTSALEIVMRYLNLKGAEVLVPTNTFIACPNSVLYSGGKPVFVDMDRENFCMDIEDMEKKINKNTKAVMAVHIAGLPVPRIYEIKNICKDRGIMLIEDASHAHGAMIGERKVGSIGDVGCFSMLATKIMTTGTGGIITTNDEKLAEFSSSVRFHGGIKNNLDKIVNFGNDWLLTEIDAILGSRQLKKLDSMLERRIRIAEKYYELLNGVDGIHLYLSPKDVKHSYYKVLAMLDKNIDREKLREIAKTKYEIEIGALYPIPCHMQPIYSQQGACPVAEEVLPHQISLPIFATMEDQQIIYVVESLKEIIKNLRK